MAVGDYVIACPGVHRIAAPKTWVRSPQEPDTTQLVPPAKISFHEESQSEQR